LAPEQVADGPGFFFAVQTPDWQYSVDAQFASTVQPPHTGPLQLLAPQDCV
jgi:hypothetical protein